MRVPVLFPRVAVDTNDGVVLRWYVDIGDRVAAGSPLLEVETAKVSVDIEAPCAGILESKEAGVDETVEAGDIVAYIGAEQGASASTRGAS